MFLTNGAYVLCEERVRPQRPKATGGAT